MTPKEKAIELVEKYYEMLPQWVNVEDSKKCALIAVDEILEIDIPGYPAQFEYDDFLKYWQEVKQEIQNL